MKLFKMPRHGEAWRHYKGTLYLVNCLQISTNTGNIEVSYFKAEEELTHPDHRENYTRDLGEFLGSVPEEKFPRFRFERDAPR